MRSLPISEKLHNIRVLPEPLPSCLTRQNAALICYSFATTLLRTIQADTLGSIQIEFSAELIPGNQCTKEAPLTNLYFCKQALNKASLPFLSLGDPRPAYRFISFLAQNFSTTRKVFGKPSIRSTVKLIFFFFSLLSTLCSKSFS